LQAALSPELNDRVVTEAPYGDERGRTRKARLQRLHRKPLLGQGSLAKGRQDVLDQSLKDAGS
jgi:hypothetical protein